MKHEAGPAAPLVPQSLGGGGWRRVAILDPAYSFFPEICACGAQAGFLFRTAFVLSGFYDNFYLYQAVNNYLLPNTKLVAPEYAEYYDSLSLIVDLVSHV